MTLKLPAISSGSLVVCDDEIELRIIGDRPRDAIDALIEMSRSEHLALRIFSRGLESGYSIDLDDGPTDLDDPTYGHWDPRTQMRISTPESSVCIYAVPLAGIGHRLSLADVAIRIETLTRPEAIRLAFGLTDDECPALGRRA